MNSYLAANVIMLIDSMAYQVFRASLSIFSRLITHFLTVKIGYLVYVFKVRADIQEGFKSLAKGRSTGDDSIVSSDKIDNRPRYNNLSLDFQSFT
jgi:hypothetical protein